MSTLESQVDDVGRVWLTHGVKSATPVSKEQRELVKLLSLEHNQLEVSKLTGVPYDNVRQIISRSKRKAIAQAQAIQSKAGIVTTSQTPIATVVQTLTDNLAEHERETRLSLARYARRAASDAENATLRDAPLVHKAAQVAGIVHKWDSEKSNTQFTLNVLNINSLDNRLGNDSEVIDT